LPEEKSTTTLHLIERRVEKRILVYVPVEVTEIDSDGQLVTERTFIEDVSDFGCRFTTRGSVKQGETIAVKILGRDGSTLPKEDAQLYEVMWVAPKDHGYSVGARLLQGEMLANAKFPQDKFSPNIGGQKHDSK
jgi:PilZ domain-containing protein